MSILLFYILYIILFYESFYCPNISITDLWPVGGTIFWSCQTRIWAPMQTYGTPAFLLFIFTVNPPHSEIWNCLPIQSASSFPGSLTHNSTCCLSDFSCWQHFRIDPKMIGRIPGNVVLLFQAFCLNYESRWKVKMIDCEIKQCTDPQWSACLSLGSLHV